jgi:hypothetical protein
LTGLTIPPSVVTIKENAFAGNLLTVVTAAPHWDGSLAMGVFTGNAPFVVLTTDAATATVIGYNGGDKRVVIPERLYDLPVTGIGTRAFENRGLSGVTIPGSVTSIGWAAFAGNHLTAVTIPGSVTAIGEYAFHGNPLTAVTIPRSVTYIGENAFDRPVIVSRE